LKAELYKLLLTEVDGKQMVVIVHELLHLKVPNHGKLFKSLLNSHCTDWRKFGSRNLYK